MTNLFVGNLSFQTTDSDLVSVFGEFGPVEKANVVRDRDSGQSRGFGFVEMTSAADASRAMNALNGEALNGRAINVNEARPREKNGGQNRSGGPGYDRQRRDNRW
jgi:RNA recognition motif-containing protein